MAAERSQRAAFSFLLLPLFFFFLFSGCRDGADRKAQLI